APIRPGPGAAVRRPQSLQLFRSCCHIIMHRRDCRAGVAGKRREAHRRRRRAALFAKALLIIRDRHSHFFIGNSPGPEYHGTSISFHPHAETITMSKHLVVALSLAAWLLSAGAAFAEPD